MPIDPQALLARRFAPLDHRYDDKDSILYALGCGLGADPLDREQLRYVYEDGLRVLPTMAVILGHPGFWVREADTGVDWPRVLHAEQSFTLTRPLSPVGHVRAENRVSAIYDKGREKGALLCQERSIVDVASGELLATVNAASMLRGDGGRGGSAGNPPPPHVVPQRAADAACDLAIPLRSALIYRLSGDRNPLHADPDVARGAGFDRPILHGLATMGVACHAILRGMLEYRGELLKAMRVRFSAPVLPGDTLRTEMWRDGSVISFQSTVLERGAVALTAGRAELW